jgi:DNA-directed RNA polymerase subunit E'/Rpb7
MQYTAVFEEQIPLTPKDMRGAIDSFDTILEEKLRSRLENRCSKHGFVLPGTVRILSRSMGNLEKGRFTGNILFYLQAEATVLNPPDGTVLEGEVIRKNKMGIYVSYKDAIRVIVPRDLHIGNEEFEGLQIGETVRVEVKKSRFQINDEYLLSVGVFQAKVSDSTEGDKQVVKASASTEAEEEEDQEEEDEGQVDQEDEADDFQESGPNAEEEEEAEEEVEEEAE